jgi:hypothetical protein
MYKENTIRDSMHCHIYSTVLYCIVCVITILSIGRHVKRARCRHGMAHPRVANGGEVLQIWG